MGTRWGVNRTVAQVHALLFISPQPLNADDIVEALDVARSNVSTSLKELQGWGIVRLVHVQADKRDHFESLKDVWEMFRIVMDERKKREFDPTMHMLRECIAEAEKDKATDEYTEERLKELYAFFETTEHAVCPGPPLDAGGDLQVHEGGRQGAQGTGARSVMEATRHVTKPMRSALPPAAPCRRRQRSDGGSHGRTGVHERTEPRS